MDTQRPSKVEPLRGQSRSLPRRGRKVRMVGDAPLPPQEALRLLKEGNQRFARGEARAARGQNIHQDQKGGESEAASQFGSLAS